MKQMWLIIAKYLSELLKTQISDSNYQNRWTVLDRNYKKYVDNQKSTGKGIKYFDYAEEMDGLFEKNKAVYPEIVLSNDRIHIPDTSDLENELQIENENIENSPGPGINHLQTDSPAVEKTKNYNTKNRIVKRKKYSFRKYSP
ncbi:hypothetical protein NQ314_017086 [Rhamnusium bicolor]|uniref:Uncharacterized protein n=1 Tax=Rhamnusium bicolor TaxID=1586634 RepID=A0AAV8WU41_9CUCU|nr:hypothetical protein NQ314_017086 [Rhamnusium bicolor]